MSQDEAFLLEAVPESIAAWTEQRARWVVGRPKTHNGLEWVVNDLQHWAPGETLRVAFLGGTTDLHAAIAETLQAVQDACNISFDVGLDAGTGLYRSWSEEDRDYRAELRVSFDQGGYFSLVGRDSVNSELGRPDDPVGGRPWQRSLNLGGYDVERPYRWKGTVIHEFLHALGFYHEHQNLTGPCQEAFRWDDDPGYQATTDARGTYIVDGDGRRPGIYTYLAGYPNGWPRHKVDHNLRPTQAEGVAYGPFDRASVMLYRFPPLFYQTPDTPCAPAGTGEELSPGDVEGLKRIYPATDAGIAATVARRTELLESLPDSGLESTSARTFAANAAAVLAAGLRRLTGRG